MDNEQQRLEDEAHRAAREHREMVASTWMPVDLRNEVADGLDPDHPTILHRTDGAAMFYRGKTHALVGEPESGKTWLALAGAAEIIAAGGNVFYVDYEDSAKGIVRRLVYLGLSLEDVLARLVYFRPGKPLDKTPGSNKALMAAGMRYEPALVILDGVTEAMTSHRFDPNDMQDVAEFYDLLPRRWDRTGSAVVMIDHVVKSKDDRGRYAIGSQHKLAGINGAVFKFEVEDAIAPGLHGTVKVSVSKDREGEVRAASKDGKVVGTMHLRPAPDRGPRHLDVTIEPDRDTWEPSESLRAAVIGELRKGPATKSVIADRIGRAREDVGRVLEWYKPSGVVEGEDRRPWRLVREPDPERTPADLNGSRTADPSGPQPDPVLHA